MSSIIHKYRIEDVPISLKKRRKLKYDWDEDAVKEVSEIKLRNPSASLRSTILEVLHEYLTPNELINIETHFRRIYDRIKISNLNDEF